MLIYNYTIYASFIYSGLRVTFTFTRSFLTLSQWQYGLTSVQGLNIVNVRERFKIKYCLSKKHLYIC